MMNVEATYNSYNELLDFSHKMSIKNHCKLSVNLNQKLSPELLKNLKNY